MSRSSGKEIQFIVGHKPLSGLLLKPDDARCLLLLAHGAGAGMRHAFMQGLAERLARRKVATLRYQFPYMEKRVKRPDPQPVLVQTVRAACTAARKHAGELPLFAGGKSMGGRMTSIAAAEAPLEDVRGLLYFGYPLHAPGKPGTDRAEHLFKIQLPMLFVQGSRDTLAQLATLEPVCNRLGERAELFVVEGGDHSFHVLKSSGRTDDEALEEAVRKASEWMEKHR